MAKHFGKDTTPNALQLVVKRRVKPAVKLLRDCVVTGDDPQAIDIINVYENTEFQKCFGSDATSGGLRFQFSVAIRPNVVLIQQARAAGKDCKDLGIGAGFYRQTCYTLQGRPGFQFTDRFKPVAKRQLGMLAAGEDPKDINLEDCKPTKGGKEIASLMGSDTTVRAIQSEIYERIKAIGNHQVHMRATNQDPATINIASFNDRQGRQDMCKYFGTDSTRGGIEFQFRAIKADAKRQRACFEAGGDPQTLNIGSGKAIAQHLNDGTTAVALQHRFRPIKKEADDMKAAVAREYGEGVTGKAVSTYFERAKKDPNWDRSRSAADNKIGTPKSTPRKRGPKGSAKKATTNNTETDDEENFEGSPSKKGILNKTQGGRVEKHRNGRAKAVNYNEEDSADEEGGNDTPNVKMEALDFGNGHIVNGNGNGHAEIEDEELYADEEYI